MVLTVFQYTEKESNPSTNITVHWAIFCIDSSAESNECDSSSGAVYSVAIVRQIRRAYHMKRVAMWPT